MSEDEEPKYALPPLARGGLFAEPNFKPRLADRLGSVRTDTGVSEHWPKDIAPVFYPHVNNPLAVGQPTPPKPAPPLPMHGAVIRVGQEHQGEGEKTLVEVPGGESELPDRSLLGTPPGNSEPEPITPGSSVRGKVDLGPPEGLLEPEAAVAPTARYGLAQVGGGGATEVSVVERPQEPVEVIEASGAMVAAAGVGQAPAAPTAAPEELGEYEAPLELEGEEPG